MDDRRRELEDAASRRFDVIVVGGGINGAGIARAAAARGYAVLLLDKQDWGFGTTWRSTKLIHGGLRYLEHGELGLVFESLQDRATLLRTAPHLVRPLPFLLPVYAGGRPMPLLRAGLTLYDLLALGGGLPRHTALSRERAIAAEPRLRREGLRGGLAYWDAQVELPERLCIESVLRARDAGAATFSYLRVERVIAARGRVAGVTATDTLGRGSYEFRAPVVVNAAGPWVDEVLRGAGIGGRRIGGTRGAHLVVDFPGGGPRRPLYAEAADRRPFFILPWRGAHLVSTTDVRVDGPEETLPGDAEIEYLIEATQNLLPGERIGLEHVRHAYGGIRPLPFTTAGAAGAITRRHHILDHGDAGLEGLHSIVGGKLSTYLSLAGQVIRRLPNQDGPARDDKGGPLVPGDWTPDPAHVEERRLWRIYGPRAAGVLRLQQEETCGGATLCPHTRETVAQARWAVDREGALTVGDVLLRRTPAGWSECLGLDAASAVAEVLGTRRGWTEGERRAAVDAYAAEVRATFRTIGSLPASVSIG